MSASPPTSNDCKSNRIEVQHLRKEYGDIAAVKDVSFVDTPARYLKITQTGISPTQSWWSIHELTLSCAPN